MANILDGLIDTIGDPFLQADIRGEVARLRGGKSFGLVFERHLPETVRLLDYPVERGVKVQLRELHGSRSWQVRDVVGGVAEVVDADGEVSRVPVEDLAVVRDFGEPIFPGLRRIGSVENGGQRPHHAAINAENFHALETLLYTCESQVDLIYIDPPYNTGATDWKYNNDYVDRNDVYSHSKWLSFMEKRLELAKRLLSPDSVLVVTVDENELHHLGILLETLFPTALRQLVTICINPSGASGEGLSRVEEYAIFVFLGASRPVRVQDNLLQEVLTDEGDLAWESLLRRGNVWYRPKRKNLCYPVKIDFKTRQIVGVGQPFDGEDESKRITMLDGYPVAWPVRKDGRLGIWRTNGESLMDLVQKGYAYPGAQDHKRGTWAIKYLMSGTVDAIEKGDIVVDRSGKRGEVVVVSGAGNGSVAKTMWVRGRHTAGGSWGTQLVSSLLGVRGGFTFPKSVYAVRDVIELAVGDKPNALVLDFFAGTGTSLHAVALLNRDDGGQRRCILVTNNEVNGELAAELTALGLRSGDQAWESRGVFLSATMPRCVAAIAGKRLDGTAVEGQYLDGTPIAEGFSENVDFFELTYLRQDLVSRGAAFEAIAPLLWLRAGATGPMVERTEEGFAVPEGARYGVLFNVAHWRPFADLVAARGDLTHVFIVTDSLAQYQQVISDLPSHLETVMLYEDYLSNFEINTGSRR